MSDYLTKDTKGHWAIYPDSSIRATMANYYIPLKDLTKYVMYKYKNEDIVVIKRFAIRINKINVSL